MITASPVRSYKTTVFSCHGLFTKIFISISSHLISYKDNVSRANLILSVSHILKKFYKPALLLHQCIPDTQTEIGIGGRIGKREIRSIDFPVVKQP